MKEKKRAKRKLSLAEQKVRVVTAFRGSKETEMDLSVGDEVTVLLKVMCASIPKVVSLADFEPGRRIIQRSPHKKSWDLKQNSRGRRRQRRQNNKTNYTRQKAHVNM